MKSARSIKRTKVVATRGRKRAAQRKSRHPQAKHVLPKRSKKLHSKPAKKALIVTARKRSVAKKLKPASKVAPKPPVTVEAKRRQFRSRATLNGCSRRKLVAFAEGRMELDEKLDILYHLDRCQKCWDDLYLIRKSKNGRLYNRKTRTYSEADIKALEKEQVRAEDEEVEAEDAFDVA